MGDQNSDNLTRHLNQQGLALWEADAERGRVRDVEAVVLDTDTTFVPPPPPPVEQRAFVQPPPIQLYRERILRLEREQHQLHELVDGIALEIEQGETILRDRERQLQMLRDALLKRRELLDHKRDELRAHAQELSAARQQLDNEQRKQREYEQRIQQEQRIRQQEQAALYRNETMGVSVPANGYQDYEQSYGLSAGASQAQGGILARHREQTTGGVNQSRIQPLPEDFQPPQWCFQALQQTHGIPVEYAQQQLDDFKMYWLCTGEARKAWDYRFVRHVRYQWEREKGQSEGRTARRQPTTEELTDTSWADKYDFDFD